MFFVIELDKININNIIFCNVVNNNVINGTFTKLNYGNDKCILNGLFLLFPIETITHTNNKIIFNSLREHNLNIIKLLYEFENQILNKYIQYKNMKLTKKLILSSQMKIGYMKIYKNKNTIENNDFNLDVCGSIHKLVIKISGIWDNGKECGITFKLYSGTIV